MAMILFDYLAALPMIEGYFGNAEWELGDGLVLYIVCLVHLKKIDKVISHLMIGFFTSTDRSYFHSHTNLLKNTLSPQSLTLPSLHIISLLKNL